MSLDNRLRSSVEGLGGQGGALDDTQGFTSTFVNGLEHCAQSHALKEEIEALDLLCACQYDVRLPKNGGGGALEWKRLGARAPFLQLARSHKKPSARYVPAPQELTILGITSCRRLKVVCWNLPCPDCNFRGSLPGPPMDLCWLAAVVTVAVHLGACHLTRRPRPRFDGEECPSLRVAINITRGYT